MRNLPLSRFYSCPGFPGKIISQVLGHIWRQRGTLAHFKEAVLLGDLDDFTVSLKDEMSSGRLVTTYGKGFDIKAVSMF